SGRLSGIAAAAGCVRRERPAVTNYERGRYVFALPAGAMCSSHINEELGGQRVATMGFGIVRTRRQERQEASCGGGGSQTVGVAAPAVGDAESVPAVLR